MCKLGHTGGNGLESTKRVDVVDGLEEHGEGKKQLEEEYNEC